MMGKHALSPPPRLLGSVWVLQAILLFASGIPTVESSWDKKYGGSESYWDYKERTSILIPMPPGKAWESVMLRMPSGV